LQDPVTSERRMLHSLWIPAANCTKDITWSLKMKKRHYNNGDGEFILEPISDSLVMVTHRDQTGYFGINKEWDVARAYTYTTRKSQVDNDGIIGVFGYRTACEALDMLCRLMLSDQRREDSRRINPEGRKEAARQVMREFLEELPD